MHGMRPPERPDRPLINPRSTLDQPLARFFVSLLVTFRTVFLAPPTTRLRGLGAGFFAPLAAFLALERPLAADLDGAPAAFLAVLADPPLRLADPGFLDALLSIAPIACRIRPISRVTSSMVIMPSTVSSFRRSE